VEVVWRWQYVYLGKLLLEIMNLYSRAQWVGISSVRDCKWPISDSV